MAEKLYSYRMTDIPANELDKVVANFESEGARVEKTRQPDGNWTVEAFFGEAAIKGLS